MYLFTFILRFLKRKEKKDFNIFFTPLDVLKLLRLFAKKTILEQEASPFQT